MAAFTGTNGSDFLVGTENSDRFTPLLGYDYVDGRGGVDTLVVSYSSLTSTSTSYSYINSSGGSFHGYIASADGSSQASFNSIEKIEAVLDQGDNFLFIDAAALASGAKLQIDGGQGTDRLSLNFQTLTGATNFEVKDNGKVESNRGSFSNFESYEISLGAGNNKVTTGDGNDHISSFGGTSVIKTGKGDDLIVSVGSADKVDGGDGSDWWSGTYEDSLVPIQLNFDGSVGTLSNGGSFKNVEQVSLAGTEGNDQVVLTGTIEGWMNLQGRGGFDTLNADFMSDVTDPDFLVIGSSVEGGLHGGLGLNQQSGFMEFESVNYVAGNGDSHIEMYLQGMVPGGQLTVDGAGGTDFGFLVLWPESDDNFTLDTGIVTSDFGVTLLNFEETTLWGGLGNDSFSVTGQVRAYLEGGEGVDTAVLDYSSSTADVFAYAYGGWAGFSGWMSSVDEAQNITNVGYTLENVVMTLGSGSDVFQAGSFEQATPGSTLSVDAGGGLDQLELYLTDFGNVTFEADGSGNVSTNLGASFSNFEDYFIQLGAFENLISTGSGNDQIYSDGGSSVISTGGGDDNIETWMGTDTVDGGDGYDSWSGEYQQAYDGMSFALGEEDPDADVSVAYVEQVQLIAGSGNDVMDVSGDLYAILYGGGGSDELSLDYSSTSENAEAEIFGGNGSLHGWLVTGGANISYDAIESVEMHLGGGDDRVNVGLLENAGGSAIFLDAGGGRDRLDINLLNYGDVVFEADGSGNVTTNTGATFTNFEDYTVWLGAANNVVTTASGDDQITAYFGGTNTISTGSGDDQVSVGQFATSPGASLTADGGDGIDQLSLDLSDASEAIEFSVAEDGTITSNLNVTASNFEYISLTLGLGDDVVTFSAGGSVDGGAGNDVLTGGSSGNGLTGGEGDDIIAGGGGFDFMVGGDGADTFVFQDGADEFIVDFVWDFSSAQGDIMDLVAIDADVNAEGDQAFSFIGSGAFTGTAGELRIEEFQPGQVIVEGDMNGDGQAELWLNIGNFTSLSASDFFL